MHKAQAAERLEDPSQRSRCRAIRSFLCFLVSYRPVAYNTDCLQGSSGGPREDNITGLLVRAPETDWRKSSVIAVDAGAHLASIIRILENDMPVHSEKLPSPDYCKLLEDGPFAGVRFPHISAKANALYFFREMLHAFLITHPHLDHLSGMAINTPALEYGREAKAIVALPPAIDAIKTHIFNDAIWPNLSDEGHGGVGFVTYRRLIEGGNPRLGFGESRGYVNVCDGLATKCWSVSHGKCHRRHQSLSHARGESFGFNGVGDGYTFPSRRMSRMSDDAHGYFAAIAQQHGQPGQHHPSMPPAPGTPALVPGAVSMPSMEKDHMFEPVTSSAFFIRNDASGHELLIFGDTEPDSVSMSPRNHIVWEDAAPKIANGSLKAIFIECSYVDSVRDEDLYGHLCPRHLIAELTFLANRVVAAQAHFNTEASKTANTNGPGLYLQEPPTSADLKKKRKRGHNGELSAPPEVQPMSMPSPVAQSTHVGRSVSNTRRKTSHGTVVPNASPRVDTYDGQHHARPLTPQRRSHPAQSHLGALTEVPPTAPAKHDAQVQQLLQHQQSKLDEPLKGVTVHIIHVKDTLMDGPTPGDVILGQLETQGNEAGLGCMFDVTSCGESIWI